MVRLVREILLFTQDLWRAAFSQLAIPQGAATIKFL
jgi:hypothetical protein